MIQIHALGVAVNVNLTGSGLTETGFEELWRRCLRPGLAVAAPVISVSHPTTFEAVTQQITRALIEQQWGRLLMLHAGAVTDPASGRSLAYVAPGGTGKSTLTTLLATELGYVTDETVALSPETLQIYPYPKPVTWARETGTRKVEHAPDALGLRATPAAPRLSRLVVLRRTEGAAPRFTRLGLLDAIEALVPETSSLGKLDRPLHLLARVFERVGGVTLIEYGEAADIVDWCRESLATPAEPPCDAPAVPEPVASEERGPRPVEELAGEELASLEEDRGRTAQGPEVVTRAPHLDLLTVGDESAVLQQEQLLRLGPIATAIIELLTQPRTVEELAPALEARFGRPANGDLTAAVEEQLRGLIQHGIAHR